MSFESCHIEYDLSRRRRFVAHLGVWAPYLGGVVFIVGGGSAAIIALSVSPWFGIGGAVLISFINAFFPVLNVNKFLYGIMHLNALVVIAVSIFRLIG
jgi:hypothetical protein